MGGASILHIGNTGLQAAKKALSTAGHNVANANTEGYSRQRVEQSTNTPIGEGNLSLGTGVKLNKVDRIHDKFIEKRMNNTKSSHSFNEERDFQLTQLEDIFNEANNDGINKVINRFFNSFRELSNQPENETLRSVVRENAKLVVKDFQNISKKLDGVEHQINLKIESNVNDINQLIKSVSKLNKEITMMTSTHGETGDLKDQRDLAVSKLSEYMQVNTYYNNKNQLVVQAVDIGTLVEGGNYQELKTSFTRKSSDKNSKGTIDVFFKQRPSVSILGKAKQGKLSALRDTRENEINSHRKNLNDLAYNLGNIVNAIHKRGFPNKKIATNAQGQIIESKPSLNFFKVPSDKQFAAATIDLSEEIKTDLNNIATGLNPNTPGDNRIALAMAKIQNEKIFEDGTATMEEQYLKTVGKVGLVTSKTRLDLEQTEGLLAQVKSMRERISGVSIDEETADMVRFQHAYEASARVMKTAGEMFNAVLRLVD